MDKLELGTGVEPRRLEDIKSAAALLVLGPVEGYVGAPQAAKDTVVAINGIYAEAALRNRSDAQSSPGANSSV